MCAILCTLLSPEQRNSVPALILVILHSHYSTSSPLLYSRPFLWIMDFPLLQNVYLRTKHMKTKCFYQKFSLPKPELAET